MNPCFSSLASQSPFYRDPLCNLYNGFLHQHTLPNQCKFRLPLYSVKDHSAQLNTSNTFLEVSRNVMHKTSGKCFMLVQSLHCYFMVTTVSCAVKLLVCPMRAACHRNSRWYGLTSWVQAGGPNCRSNSSTTANPTERETNRRKTKLLVGWVTTKQYAERLLRH